MQDHTFSCACCPTKMESGGVCPKCGWTDFDPDDVKLETEMKNTPENERLINELVEDIENVGRLRETIEKQEKIITLLTTQRNELARLVRLNPLVKSLSLAECDRRIEAIKRGEDV